MCRGSAHNYKLKTVNNRRKLRPNQNIVIHENLTRIRLSECLKETIKKCYVNAHSVNNKADSIYVSTSKMKA